MRRASSRSASVVEQIWQQLRTLIFSSGLAPGSRLVDLDIAAQMERYLVIYDVARFVDLRRVADTHIPIVEALEQGDANLAVRRVEEHLGHMPSLPPPPEHRAREWGDDA